MPETKCLNGILREGDLVLSTVDDEDYACLVGRVLTIVPLGSPEHDTGNDTDDVHVDFTGDYGPKRIREIEATFSALFREKKTMDDVPLDYSIMSPDCLIRITGTDNETLARLRASSEFAHIYAYRVLRTQYDSLNEAIGKQPEMRRVRGIYSEYADGVRKVVQFENGLFHIWGSESVEYDNGAVTETVAIVEFPGGVVRTVSPNALSFILPDGAQEMDRHEKSLE